MGQNQPPDSDASIDIKLVFQVTHGNKQAFNLLVDKYQHRVLSLVRRYIDDPIEAVDVVQEVFIKTYRALPNFRGDCAFYTWLYRIAINTAKNYAITHVKKTFESDVDFSEIEFLIESKHIAQNNQPELLLYRDELDLVISDVLDALPAELKMTLQLRDIDGLTYEEIANVMSCPIGTVRSRIYRARDAIHRRIKPMIKG